MSVKTRIVAKLKELLAESEAVHNGPFPIHERQHAGGHAGGQASAFHAAIDAVEKTDEPTVPGPDLKVLERVLSLLTAADNAAHLNPEPDAVFYVLFKHPDVEALIAILDYIGTLALPPETAAAIAAYKAEGQVSLAG